MVFGFAKNRKTGKKSIDYVIQATVIKKKKKLLITVSKKDQCK